MEFDVLKQAVRGQGHRLAMIALIAGGIAIGTSPIFVRLSEVGPLSTAFWRLALAFIPLWICAKTIKQPAVDERPAKLSDYIMLALPGVFIGADLAAWHVSILMTTVANATLFANMAPIFVTIGAWALFGARVSGHFLIGLAAALIGIFVLKGGMGNLMGEQSLGDLIALLAAVFYAGYILIIGRLRARFSTMTIMLWSTGVAGLCMLPLAAFMESPIIPFTLYGWAVLLGLALITHAAGQGLITYALAYLPASFSSLTLLLQPVVAAILAWIILSEPIGLMQGIGGVIIIAGILIARRG